MVGGRSSGSLVLLNHQQIFERWFNVGNIDYTTAPPEKITESFLRNQLKNDFGCFVDTSLKATIDGVPVKNPFQYVEEAKYFKTYVPKNNILGLPGEGKIVGVDKGYYLFLLPLRPGKHTIKFEAKDSCGVQNISYNITVKPW
jgi:hypothetical protein